MLMHAYVAAQVSGRANTLSRKILPRNYHIVEPEYSYTMQVGIQIVIFKKRVVNVSCTPVILLWANIASACMNIWKISILSRQIWCFDPFCVPV